MNINYSHDELEQLERLEQLQQMERLLQLQQLQQLQQMERLQQTVRLEQLEYFVKDYRELVIDTDDVVYCDPPYVGTSHNYGGF
ncbi:DNA adenine methylase, partial [Secundilactobacillus paracollinoides]